MKKITRKSKTETLLTGGEENPVIIIDVIDIVFSL